MRDRCAQGLAALLFGLSLAGCGNAEPQVAADGPAPATTAAVPGTETAAAFLDLGRGAVDTVPWASRVGYSMSGTEVTVLRPGEELVASLLVCPAGQSTYEGRDCPVSPLTTLAGWTEDGGEVVIEPGAPRRVGCSTTGTPAAVAGLVAVTLRPPTSERDCFTDFAVSLYLDRDGRVAWVDFTLSGP